MVGSRMWKVGDVNAALVPQMKDDNFAVLID